MSYTDEQKQAIFRKLGGSCTYCGCPLHFELYGRCDEETPPEGAWEVDHWIPRSWFKNPKHADVFMNLWPACCECNDDKGNRVTGEVYILERVTNNRKTNQRSVETLVDVASSK